MANTLTLTINKQWFDMIASGEKPEEYRQIKPYYLNRFVKIKSKNPWSEFIASLVKDEILEAGSLEEAKIVFSRVYNNRYDTLLLRNGYSSSSPTLLVELKDITIGEGNPAWGAEPGKRYFVLKLGRVLSKNIEV